MPFRCTDLLLNEEENCLGNGFHCEWTLTTLDHQSSRISSVFHWGSWMQAQMTPLLTLWEELCRTQPVRKEGGSEKTTHISAALLQFLKLKGSWGEGLRRWAVGMSPGFSFTVTEASFVRLLWKPSSDSYGTWLLMTSVTGASLLNLYKIHTNLLLWRMISDKLCLLQHGMEMIWM